jgi:hypothetical protein
MIYGKALAVGPGKKVSVCTGQGDFENHCTSLYVYTLKKEKKKKRKKEKSIDS